MNTNFNNSNISSDEIIENARKELLGAPQINISQINFIDELNKILLGRHECLKVIEDTIENNSTLFKFFVSANFKADDSVGSVFRIALENMANIIHEYDTVARDISDQTLLNRIRELEMKNKELQNALDQIAKIFGVIK